MIEDKGERLARVEENQKWVMSHLADIRAMLERSLSEKAEAHERILERVDVLENYVAGIKTKLWLVGLVAGAVLTTCWELIKARLWGDHP
jgi:hypothetical protein